MDLMADALAASTKHKVDASGNHYQDAERQLMADVNTIRAQFGADSSTYKHYMDALNRDLQGDSALLPHLAIAWAQDSFTTLDSNKDGAIDSSELAKAHDSTEPLYATLIGSLQNQYDPLKQAHHDPTGDWAWLLDGPERDGITAADLSSAQPPPDSGTATGDPTWVPPPWWIILPQPGAPEPPEEPVTTGGAPGNAGGAPGNAGAPPREPEPMPAPLPPEPGPPGPPLTPPWEDPPPPAEPIPPPVEGPPADPPVIEPQAMVDPPPP